MDGPEKDLRSIIADFRLFDFFSIINPKEELILFHLRCNRRRLRMVPKSGRPCSRPRWIFVAAKSRSIPRGLASNSSLRTALVICRSIRNKIRKGVNFDDICNELLLKTQNFDIFWACLKGQSLQETTFHSLCFFEEMRGVMTYVCVHLLSSLEQESPEVWVQPDARWDEAVDAVESARQTEATEDSPSGCDLLNCRVDLTVTEPAWGKKGERGRY